MRERHLGRECVSMCERPPMDIHRVRIMCERECQRVYEEGPMESETTRKRLMYTLIKNINCIQILGWDHDICNRRKERSMIHQTSIFYRI